VSLHATKPFSTCFPTCPLTTKELELRNRGRKLAEIIIELEADFNQTLPPTFVSSYRTRVAELFEAQLHPMPGAEQTLRELTCPICVASSAPVAKINHALTLTGLEAYFKGHIYSSYDVGFWKPHPGLFLHAAASMGFQPQDCAVVDDSEVGVEAALAAGMMAYQLIPGGGDLEPGAVRPSNLMDVLKLFPPAV